MTSNKVAQILRAQARARISAGVEDHVSWMAARGDLDGLRARADAGDEYAALRLIDLLVVRGNFDEAVQILRVRADAGDAGAAQELADLLVACGDLDGLRARADAGDEYAASRLDERGDLSELRRLIGRLTERGLDEEAERLRRFRLNPDGSIA